MNAIRTITVTTLGAIGAGLLSLSLPVQAQTPSFQITAYTDRGGGVSDGAPFSFGGSIGQPNAGTPMIGGAFGISGGFWVVPEIGSIPALSILLGVPATGANTVILTWPNPSTGYVPQQTTNISAAGGGWADLTQTPVVNGANKEVTLIATGRASLFRLWRP